VNKIPTMEKKRLNALEVTATMMTLLSTQEFYNDLLDVANTADRNVAKGKFKALCNKANVKKGSMRKYLFTILRDASIKGAKTVDMNDPLLDGLDASFCWS